MLIASLVKESNYFKMYLPEGVYRELRNLTRERYQLRKKLNSSKNMLRSLLDSYFPEFERIFKDLLGKTSVYILKNCPFPADILKLTEEQLVEVIKLGSRKRLGHKKAQELRQSAMSSVGLREGLESTCYRIGSRLEEIAFYQRQMANIEEEMARQLDETGFKRNLLSIPGVGIITAARFLGEVGDIRRFDSPEQIIKLAGLNLKSNSSGKKSGEKKITKRGRSELRCLLYQSALIMVSKNPQMQRLYQYYRTRSVNPLKTKQALVVISKKLVRIMFALMKKDELYDPFAVLGGTRVESAA
jgi:transposase